MYSNIRMYRYNNIGDCMNVFQGQISLSGERNGCGRQLSFFSAV